MSEQPQALPALARPQPRLPAARCIVEALASLKLTLFALLLLALGVVQYGLLGSPVAEWIAGPLLLLALNLAAAIAANRVFRRNVPLLVFHLALLAIVLLAAAGRLTFLKGQVELAEGEVFTGELTRREAGRFHGGPLEGIRFVNDGFSIRYAAGLRRGETRNRIRVFESGGAVTERVIGDNEPLIAAGYRFYTTFNKGFSLVFRWYPRNGIPERGTVNLPSYPLNEHRQALEWKLPGTGTPIWTMLEFDQPPLDPSRPGEFRKPDRHSIVVRMGEERRELAPGGELALPTGVLAYEGLSTWMGYRVFYDWTIPWLLAACVTAVASLGWHFRRRFAAPWDA